MHFDSDTSIIDVHINFLRKKLNQFGGNDLIHTIRGVGYVVRENMILCLQSVAIFL